jgi:hypothetical protein
MSAQLAIPATTFVLRSIIEARLKIAYAQVAQPPQVSIEPPPRPPAAPANGAQVEAAGLVLYLHHVAANGAWRNMRDPHLDSNGQRVRNAPLVLDLHYLLGAYGVDLEREALLGVAMSALHRNGIVPRPMIQQILAAVQVPNQLTKLIDLLPNEPLQNQPEMITVTQQALDVDLSTKIWGALQSPMRPCAYYLVTTVFLDTGEVYKDPPDVKQVSIEAEATA